MQVQGNFLNRNVPFIDSVLRSRDDEAALDQAAALLYEAEKRYGLAFLHAPGVLVVAREPDDDWSSQVLQPFLAETHFLLTGADCQQLTLYDAEGYDRTYSWRHWGAEMAEWANRHVMRHKSAFGKQKSWDYMTFYSADYLPVDGYSQWVEALLAVVRRKTAIYGWTFAPQLTPYSALELRKSPWWRGQIEIVQGQVYPCVPPAESAAKAIAAHLGERLHDFVLHNQLGRFYPEGTQFVIMTEPDTVLGPLWAFISRQRKPMKSRTGWMPMLPDMVFEARSPRDINRRLDTKIARWLSAGVAEVWVLDMEMHQITIHSEGKTPVVFTMHELLTGREMFPKFEMPVAGLFS
jgi:Uma2 family endonuclease